MAHMSSTYSCPTFPVLPKGVQLPRLLRWYQLYWRTTRDAICRCFPLYVQLAAMVSGRLLSARVIVQAANLTACDRQEAEPIELLLAGNCKQVWSCIAMCTNMCIYTYM